MQSREYLTGLLRRRSVVAFLCGILTLTLSFYGIIAGVNRTVSLLHRDGFTSFIYYTMLSNALAALSAAFVFPYTVEGIRRKRFALPRWVAVTHYTAAVSISFMMIFVFAFISWASPDDAFGGPNLVTHVFCPLLILISFFQMESGHLFTLKDRLAGIVPFCIYLTVYVIEVAVIGESNGGWPDIYHVQEFLPPVLAVPTALLLAFCVSTVIAALSNRLTKKRTEKIYLLWRGDMDPVEVRIEAYGIGRMAGRYGDRNGIQIPYDILTHLAERYHLETEDLMKPFVTGVLMGLKEKEK